MRLTISLVLLLSACSSAAEDLPEWTPADHGQTTSSPSNAAATDTQSNENPTLALTDTLWRAHCRSCHGADGSGGIGPAGASMPDLRDPSVQSRLSDAALVTLIQQGRGLMPSFRERISPEGIQLLVAKVRTFQQTP